MDLLEGSATKRRRPNFSDEEVFVMIEEVAQQKNILIERTEPTTLNILSKKNAWEEVRKAVNAVSHTNRSLEEVRKKFSDFRSFVKKKCALRNKDIKMRGKKLRMLS